MIIPMVLDNMEMKRIVVRIVNLFGYRNVLVVSTIALALLAAEPLRMLGSIAAPLSLVMLGMSLAQYRVRDGRPAAAGE